MTAPTDIIAHLHQATALADRAAAWLSEGDPDGAIAAASVSQAFSRLAQAELTRQALEPPAYILPTTGDYPPDLAQRITEEVNRPPDSPPTQALA